MKKSAISLARKCPERIDQRAVDHGAGSGVETIVQRWPEIFPGVDAALPDELLGGRAYALHVLEGTGQHVSFWQAVEKQPSAALRSSFVFAAYTTVRLIPHDVARLASDYF